MLQLFQLDLRLASIQITDFIGERTISVFIYIQLRRKKSIIINMLLILKDTYFNKSNMKISFVAEED